MPKRKFVARSPPEESSKASTTPSTSEQEEGVEVEQPAQKKAKPSKFAPKGKASPSKFAPAKNSSSPEIQTNNTGEEFVDLGKKKRATVRTFKGSSFVDIREFFGKDDEDLKPGKKGITLSQEQWETLKSGASAIDSMFANVKK